MASAVDEAFLRSSYAGIRQCDSEVVDCSSELEAPVARERTAFCGLAEEEEEEEAATASHRCRSASRHLRRGLLAVVLLAAALYAALYVAARDAGAPPVWSAKDVIGFYPMEGPLSTSAKCAGEAGFCICNPHHKCFSWNFEVGDVIIFEAGPSNTDLLAWERFVVGLFTFSDMMHTAIVSEVGSPPTPDNIMIMECLKPPFARVVRNSLRTVVHRWPVYGFWIKRVDKNRFMNVTRKSAAITEWTGRHLDQPFDKQMMVPFFRRYLTNGRYIQVNPNCPARRRAMELYQNDGVQTWMCSQFVMWALGFAGGLNTDGTPHKHCEHPPWAAPNVQPWPSQLARMNIWRETIHVNRCTWRGCEVVLPS